MPNFQRVKFNLTHLQTSPQIFTLNCNRGLYYGQYGIGSVALLWHNAKVLALLNMKYEIYYACLNPIPKSHFTLK